MSLPVFLRRTTSSLIHIASAKLPKLETALNETISRPGASQDASADEYNKKRRELASIAIPMEKLEVVIPGRR